MCSCVLACVRRIVRALFGHGLLGIHLKITPEATTAKADTQPSQASASSSSKYSISQPSEIACHSFFFLVDSFLDRFSGSFHGFIRCFIYLLLHSSAGPFVCWFFLVIGLFTGLFVFRHRSTVLLNVLDRSTQCDSLPLTKNIGWFIHRFLNRLTHLMVQIVFVFSSDLFIFTK